MNMNFKGVLLLSLFIGCTHFKIVLSTAREFIQHPETQHAEIGDNLTFFCYASSAIYVKWNLYHPNGTFDRILRRNTQGVIMLTTVSGPIEGSINTSIIISATQTWNNTMIRCHAEAGGSDCFSNEASLFVYSSLRPFPPTDLRITTINGSTAIVTWNHSILWKGYQFDGFDIVVSNHSNTVLSVNMLDSDTHEYILTEFSQPSCSKLNFSIAATSSLHGDSDYTIVNKKFGSDLEDVSKHMNIDTQVYFRSNGTPIMEFVIQIPSFICIYEDWTINYTVTGTELDPDSSASGMFNHRAAHTQSFSILHGLLMNQNYSLTIVISTDSGKSSITASTTFDTVFLLSFPLIYYYNEKPIASKLIVYKISLGLCLSAAILILVVFMIVLMWIYLRRGKERRSQKINDSTSRVCNAMVHNPIYDGPVYESVQQQFNTLTATTSRASNISDTSTNHPCNSQPSTPTSSEKSTRYVGPPSSADQLSKIRSKSFLSHPSPSVRDLESDTENIPRSASVSDPVIRKTQRQRNVLNLRLTLAGADSSSATVSRNAQISTDEPISAVDPIVVQSRDVDDNYTVMSPASGRGALLGKPEWSELSPEDTKKYQE